MQALFILPPPPHFSHLHRCHPSTTSLAPLRLPPLPLLHLQKTSPWTVVAGVGKALIKGKGQHSRERQRVHAGGSHDRTAARCFLPKRPQGRHQQLKMEARQLGTAGWIWNQGIKDGADLTLALKMSLGVQAVIWLTCPEFWSESRLCAD